MLTGQQAAAEARTLLGKGSSTRPGHTPGGKAGTSNPTMTAGTRKESVDRAPVGADPSGALLERIVVALEKRSQGDAPPSLETAFGMNAVAAGSLDEYEGLLTGGTADMGMKVGESGHLRLEKLKMTRMQRPDIVVLAAEKRAREDVGKLRKVKSAEFIVIVLRCNY